MSAPHDTSSDDELASRARARDAVAFEQLFHRHYMSIHAFAFRCCLNYAAAEDIAQETFVKAARAIAELREDTAFKAWLYRIARNTARDWQRDNRRDTLRKEAWADAAGVRADERLADHHAVAEALRALAPDLREAIVLTFYEEMSHAGAARVLGCAEATVSWRVYRAKLQLRKQLLSSGHRQCQP